MNKNAWLAAASLAAAYLFGLASGGLYETTVRDSREYSNLSEIFVTNKLTGEVCISTNMDTRWSCH